MTQTTNALSFVDCKVEYSNDNFSADINDISGFASAIEVSGGSRQVGEVYTADGDVAIVTHGKREPLDVASRIVYTEDGASVYEALRVIYEAGSAFYLRFSPQGGQTGEFIYTSDKTKISAWAYPSGEFGSGDPLVIEFGIRTPKLTKSVAT